MLLQIEHELLRNSFSSNDQIPRLTKDEFIIEIQVLFKVPIYTVFNSLFFISLLAQCSGDLFSHMIISCCPLLCIIGLGLLRPYVPCSDSYSFYFHFKTSLLSQQLGSVKATCKARKTEIKLNCVV